MGDRSVSLAQYECSNSMNIFRSTRRVWPTTTIPFQLFADLVVSTFAINRFNDAIDNFFRKFVQKTFWLRSVILLLK